VSAVVLDGVHLMVNGTPTGRTWSWVGVVMALPLGAAPVGVTTAAAREAKEAATAETKAICILRRLRPT
jgi:hypothetical protein